MGRIRALCSVTLLLGYDYAGLSVPLLANVSLDCVFAEPSMSRYTIVWPGFDFAEPSISPMRNKIQQSCVFTGIPMLPYAKVRNA